MKKNIIQKIIKPTVRGRVWQIFLLIIIFATLGLFVDAGSYYNKSTDWLANKTNHTIQLPKVKEKPFKLGLDLQGGTHLVYDAQVENIPVEDREAAVEGVRDVIERRINVFGVSEPVIQTNKTPEGHYRVVVELAGIKDVKEAIKMIGETPLLEFKEKTKNIRELTEEEKKQISDTNNTAKIKAEEVLGKLISGGDMTALAKEYSEDENTRELGGDLGWVTSRDNAETVEKIKDFKIGEISEELLATNQGYEILKLEDKRTKINPFTNKEEKEIKANHLLICYSGSEKCENEITKEEALTKIKEIEKEINKENFVDLVKKYSTEPGVDVSGGDLGWFGAGAMVKPFEDTVFEQKVDTISFIVETKFGYHLIYKKAERNIEEYKVNYILTRTVTEEDIVGNSLAWANTELTGKNLKRAVVQFSPNSGAPEVSLEFDKEGAKFFEEITERNINEQVAIFLDNFPISAPVVNSKITGGKAVISGKFNIQEAKLLAQRLNAGALPVPINLVNQKTVGASLGIESVNRSLKACLIGLILVALFMIGYYRLAGLLAVLSLLIYGIFVLALFKMWNITLTLSGLAGFILSIGMAVDANVLVFERIKEELREGYNVKRAIENGFRRAWPSIRDGNFSTLITCFILIQFTTSIVRGFAVTLSLGIIISMFSAIVITKNFLLLIAGNEKWLKKRKWLFIK